MYSFRESERAFHWTAKYCQHSFRRLWQAYATISILHLDPWERSCGQLACAIHSGLPAQTLDRDQGATITGTRYPRTLQRSRRPHRRNLQLSRCLTQLTSCASGKRYWTRPSSQRVRGLPASGALPSMAQQNEPVALRPSTDLILV